MLDFVWHEYLADGYPETFMKRLELTSFWAMEIKLMCQSKTLREANLVFKNFKDCNNYTQTASNREGVQSLFFLKT